MSHRQSCPTPSEPRRAFGTALTIGLLVLATGCGADSSGLTGPAEDSLDPSLHKSSRGARTIVVRTAAELVASLVPENAGRTIVLRAGTYEVSQLLVVPDRVTLEGSGVMRLNRGGQPSGFKPGTRTAIVMTGAVPGDLLSLGDGATVKRLVIEDVAGRAGNAIGVVSRRIGDRVSAMVTEVEILNPNAHGVAPLGPTGCGLVLLTLNPNMGSDPAPHAGSSISARVTRTLIHSPATGVGCGVFAFNFAPSARVSLALSGNVVGGGIIAGGGVSRPDAVHDSHTKILSRNNVYLDDSPDACLSQRTGWNLQGGSGMPVPLPNPGAERNSLHMHSVGDRLEGFTTGVFATGGRRFFPAPTAQPTSRNHVQMELIDTRITTANCGSSSPGSDLRLAGALVTGSDFDPGDGNTLRAVIRGMKGSGKRANVFEHVLGATGAQPSELSGRGNRLTIHGSAKSFSKVNRSVNPPPRSEFFMGGRW